MKSFLLGIMLIALIFIAYSSIKEMPNDGTCYAAYDHYRGDILVKLRYKALSDETIERIAKDLGRPMPKVEASKVLMLDRINFLNRNEALKVSDFIRCYVNSNNV